MKVGGKEQFMVAGLYVGGTLLLAENLCAPQRINLTEEERE